MAHNSGVARGTLTQLVSLDGIGSQITKRLLFSKDLICRTVSSST